MALIYKQTKQRYNNNPTPAPQAKKRKEGKKKSSSRNQTPHILFVGKLVTHIPLKDEQPICKLIMFYLKPFP